ncbi:glycosyltransferase family 39 protein [Nocardia sp. NEAU-G5]|uniref:Glycosyltransferase family 39 protein n=1 Tax=Nocardia albiluteola TaxID=2842303 RepID=A0ABS6B9X5_9NOCA|nr:glycosyltransferase family 39 protein [Nocardia albiluteola]MBU3066570.1 glycosyltransferase family 39 protein [Nocardia albiluteola]
MWWIAGVFAVTLGAFADRYGYHRDEMYFLAAGRHPSWGYPDQPPLTPMLARAMAAIDPDSLVLLRIPAIIAATVVVVCAGLMAREMGGGRGARALAAGTTASAALLMGAGHTLNTEVFDLAFFALVTLVVMRLVRERADYRWWLAVGALVGLGLQNKTLLIFPVVTLVAGLLLTGPRKAFATWYFAAAVAIAVAIWLPNLWWQAHNGWPQLTMGRAIAGGSSGTSNTRPQFAALQFGLMGPLSVPLWGFGLWRLWRERRYRAFAVSYALLVVVYLVTTAKAYYLGSMYPILLAAGAVPVARWLGEHRRWWAAVAAALALNAAVSAVLFLPVVPTTVQRNGILLAINSDAVETIGWPTYVRQIAAARARFAPQAQLLTDNYGEAAAIERFGGPYHLPTPYSGHNSYWWWGPPPGSAPVLTVGITNVAQLHRICSTLTPAGRLDNGLGLHNHEQHAPLFVCAPGYSWSFLWPHLEHLG